MLGKSFFGHENHLAVLDLDDALALEELAHDRDGLADQGAITFAKSCWMLRGTSRNVRLWLDSQTVKQQCRQAR